MKKYILNRILWIIFTIIAASIIAFTLMYFMPGDPAKALLGVDASEAVLQVKRTELGIDRPYIVQLGSWLYNAFLRFDFGDSWVYGTPVMDELMVRLPRTLIIGISPPWSSMLCSAPCWASLRPRTRADGRTA
jgi:ABC-type dipeptide/oligopeptide/nickel transport system permease component